MSEKKKKCTAKANAQFTNINCNSTVNFSNKQIEVLDALRFEVKSAEQLCAETTCTSAELRTIISALRNKGVRIITDTVKGGYWIARNDKEYKLWRKGYATKIANMSDSLDAMDRANYYQIMQGVRR